MPSRPLDATPSVAETLLAETRDPLFVSPPVRLARAVACSLRTGDGGARLLLTPDEAASLFGEFRAATAAAQAIDDGRLAVRTADDLTESLTLGDGTVWVHVRTDDHISSLTATDAEATDAFREPFEGKWDDAEPYTVDVPSRRVLLDTFGDRWPDAADTLSRAIEGAEAVWADDPVDSVGLCTLVGARHELFSIELGEWARDIGFSSRTEVARAKERLTEADIVETRRVPNGVGRPRQQLELADDEFASVPPEDLVSAARERISSGASPE